MKSKLFIFFSICTVALHAQIRLPRLVSDSMVLQRDTPVKIWGWASAGEAVTISFNKKTYHATTDASGKWQTVLAATKAGGPYTMEISGSNKLLLKDILMGDVWVCSGQSNMELPMSRVIDRYPNEIATANNAKIRLFNAPKTYSFTDANTDFNAGSWITTTPQSILNFTAVGYFFAKSLYEKYHVPIGLINVSLGGSPAEAWLSEDALQEFPAYLQTANKYKDGNLVKQTMQSDAAASNDWYTKLWQSDKGMQETVKWYEPNYNSSNWATMNIPGLWDDQGLKNTLGVVWFRKEVDIPASMLNKPVLLRLGTIIDRDSVYVNGKFVGTTGYQYPPRKYTIPAGILHEGKNNITIRVINYAGKGGFTKEKPYKLIADNDVVDISGKWQYQLGTTAQPIPGSTTFQYQPEGLYNGMIAPLLNYRIKGVIWFQGESNTGRAGEYTKLFSKVITTWREKWQQGNFPFLFVQLANYMEAKKQPSESGWAALRDAQRRTLAVPNTAMAVTIDIGEWNDLHPLNKQDVGKRLALAAQRLAYNDKKIVYSGPLYESMQTEGNKIILTFSNTGSGLIAKDGKPLAQFAIAGSDQKFVWANAVIENNKVVVSAPGIEHPVVVRYAWADNPEGANLYNKEGLPASPFTTAGH